MSDHEFKHELVTANCIAAALGIGTSTIIRWCNDPCNPLPHWPVQWGVTRTIYAIRPCDVVEWLTLYRTRLMGDDFTPKKRRHIKNWLQQQKAELDNG